MQSVLVHRAYEEEVSRHPPRMPFSTWSRCKCVVPPEAIENDVDELKALSRGTSGRAFFFKSVSSFGLHYTVELEEEEIQHLHSIQELPSLKLAEMAMILSASAHQ